jgi:hypothetical protein
MLKRNFENYLEQLKINMMKKIMLFLITVLFCFDLSSQKQPSPLPRRWLFIEPTLIETKSNIKLCVNPPKKYDIVNLDTSLMDHFGSYMTVTDDNGKLMMWRGARIKNGNSSLQCFESKEGINWFPSSGINNLNGMLSDFDEITETEGCVFIDPTASADSKFKNVGSYSKKGLFVSRSPDGVHWKRDKKTILYFDFDSPNVTFWDTNKNAYALYLRGWILGLPSIRRRVVVHTITPTLDLPLDIIPKEWDSVLMGKYRFPRAHECTTEIPTVIKTDESDPPLSDFYTNAVVQYPLDPYYYMAFPSLYIHYTEPDTGKSRNDGILYTQFAGSVDGEHFDRYNRPVYAMPYYPGFGPSSRTYMSTGLVVRNNEIWQYGTSYQSTHGRSGVSYPGNTITFRFIQRIDGFLSADSKDNGEIITRLVPCNGNKLIVNLKTAEDGYLKVGFLNEKGKPVAGFNIEKCDIINGDHTDYNVTWKGSSDLTSLSGKQLKLLIKSKNCKLYSFRFE